jgi:hypothetical protein
VWVVIVAVHRHLDLLASKGEKVQVADVAQALGDGRVQTATSQFGASRFDDRVVDGEGAGRIHGGLEKKECGELCSSCWLKKKKKKWRSSPPHLRPAPQLEADMAVLRAVPQPSNFKAKAAGRGPAGPPQPELNLTSAQLSGTAMAASSPWELPG